MRQVDYQNSFHISTRFFVHAQQRVAERLECLSTDLGQKYPLFFTKHEHNRSRAHFRSQHMKNNLRLVRRRQKIFL
jgi:hypothetical protein